MPRVRELHAGTGLTAAELLTVQLIGSGATPRQAGRALGISANSVSMRLMRISLLLHTSTPTSTVVECLRRGWLTLDELKPGLWRTVQ